MMVSSLTPLMMTARVITTILRPCSLCSHISRCQDERSDVPSVYSSDDPCGHHGTEGRSSLSGRAVIIERKDGHRGAEEQSSYIV
jgi:hypothetical protein